MKPFTNADTMAATILLLLPLLLLSKNKMRDLLLRVSYAFTEWCDYVVSNELKYAVVSLQCLRKEGNKFRGPLEGIIPTLPWCHRGKIRKMLGFLTIKNEVYCLWAIMLVGYSDSLRLCSKLWNHTKVEWKNGRIVERGMNREEGGSKYS